VIRPEDEGFHKHNNYPYWNESSAFSFGIPWRDMSGYIYVWHRPAMNLSASGVVLWDPSGEEIYDCLYYEVDDCQHLPENAGVLDFSLRSGLTCETIELQKAWHFTYKTQELELDLIWEAFMEPHEANWADSSRVDAWGPRHYEHCGRARGRLNLGGEVLDVDSWGIRDRTWGPREPEPGPRCDWTWAIASETSSFQLMAVSDLPHDEDPIVGTTERVVQGWYMKDGVLGELTAGCGWRRLERGDDLRPLRVVIEATDHLGRDLHAEGVCVNLLNWPNYVWWLDRQAGTRWEFDGQEAWGEVNDEISFRQNRRFHRALRNKSGSTA
jgi:hypothetical protein